MPDHLWAPWRMKYIEKPSVEGAKGGNIFIDLPNRADDEANFILHRGETAFVLLNAYPYASGHLMVAPFRQVADITLMEDNELLEINRLVAKAVTWIRGAFNPHGFNIGVNMGSAAGAGIPVHIHWHIVPRWEGDTNFMSVTGDTRVIPQSLEDTYQRLCAAMK